MLAMLCLFFRAEVNAMVIITGIIPKNRITLINDTSKIKFKQLKIGDRIPETIWNMPLQVINHPKEKKTIRLNDYKEKLIILDFMNIGCANCILSLPKYDSLQKQNQGKIELLVIMSEKQSKVRDFSAKNKIMSNISLTIVSDDTVLKSIFPHKYVSHIAWINQKTAKAITFPHYITQQNINKVLKNEVIDWRVKNDVLKYDFSSPILIPNSDKITLLSSLKRIYYSSISPNIVGVSSRNIKEIDTIKRIYKIRLINHDIVSLYRSVLDEHNKIPISHILFESKRLETVLKKPHNSNDDNWMSKNLFCYEAAFPLGTSEGLIRQKMKADLDFYFNTNGRIEKQVRFSFLLEREAKSAQNGVVPPPSKTISKFMEKYCFTQAEDLVYSLNNSLVGVPIFNGLGISEKIDIQLTGQALRDTTRLKEDLQKQKLTLKTINPTVELLVISDK